MSDLTTEEVRAALAAKTANSPLHRAKRVKNDEFFTRLEDIEAEVGHYVRGSGRNKRNPFLGKVVYLNCDDPQWSNFWVYFARKFDELGIDTLISTHYEHNGSPSYAMFLERDSSGAMIDNGVDNRGVPLVRRQELDGDGDFRSEECVELLEQADVVVTNPPFSLFREYVGQLVEHDKKFLLVSNLNCVTYKEIFPLIKDNEVWIGATKFNTGMYFGVPSSFVYRKTYKFYRELDGEQVARVPGVMWFTNLDHGKRHEEIDLVRYYEGNEDAYPRYDNYDAIEVSKVKDIPADYEGVMGVPITFLDKHNPEQFEILGASDNGAVPDTMKLPHFKAHNEPYVLGKPMYKRIMIRNLNPQKKIEFWGEVDR